MRAWPTTSSPNPPNKKKSSKQEVEEEKSIEKTGEKKKTKKKAKQGKKRSRWDGQNSKRSEIAGGSPIAAATEGSDAGTIEQPRARARREKRESVYNSDPSTMSTHPHLTMNGGDKHMNRRRNIHSGRSDYDFGTATKKASESPPTKDVPRSLIDPFYPISNPPSREFHDFASVDGFDSGSGAGVAESRSDTISGGGARSSWTPPGDLGGNSSPEAGPVAGAAAAGTAGGGTTV